MKIICINRESNLYISKGNIYDVIGKSCGNYFIINDDGWRCGYEGELFEIIPETKLSDLKVGDIIQLTNELRFKSIFGIHYEKTGSIIKLVQIFFQFEKRYKFKLGNGDYMEVLNSNFDKFIKLEENDILKVKCINNHNGGNYLTIGKVYDAEYYDENWYSIMNDKGQQTVYLVDEFE